jgi:hypothetical protein
MRYRAGIHVRHSERLRNAGPSIWVGEAVATNPMRVAQMRRPGGRAWSWVHVAPDRCRSGWMKSAPRDPRSGAGMFERFVSRRALPVPLSLPRASQ